MNTHQIFARHAWLERGWQRDVLISWNHEGLITAAEPNSTPAEGIESVSWLLPGMPNLHSHAFQRIFSGMAEFRQNPADSFWSWRKLMYEFAQQITPEQLEIIATQLYQEMLAAGYTSVCEFHYVHHQPGGKPYQDAIAMSSALVRAAQCTGIGMTLLPVLYQTSGFGGQPPEVHQRRFTHDMSSFLAFWDQLFGLCQSSNVKLGLAPHSLRAINPADLQAVLSHIFAADATAPVHIHVAEQQKEVDDCLAWSGKRPVQWLLDNFDVDSRWCLIHATHMDAQEYREAADTGAVIGLCPTTEANLGDGIFDYRQWQMYKGSWGIGSDSHITVNAAEELLQLEYSQRLRNQQRNICCNSVEPDVATYLYRKALQGGAQASGRLISGIQAGQYADFVELDAEHPALAGISSDYLLAAHVFASSRQTAIRRVWTSGTLCYQGMSMPASLHHDIAAIRRRVLANRIEE
ncbi:formimidoylglutamate deiminase|uniref:Formimidoylglutamate deiminase n=1 Tax=Brenneria salicis ATCC 15712 = DSM 30166 TaxID=714314 RepID=A0A366IBA9_9GAMM|nr:formimidoylglutamate deiminase [Brenneria salicis]NMN91724.1 formimidoylglutamate deiminase [Brenneria salicis ATCC 15712 = DSM 30166]RBP65782.1 formimidoylglutamate deiminase [Brenneria salicis ATCC 15712 = DSM 30166]RLM31822.1 formimidoylglutamate deiminase [Brenneria salicis ATCC 15712 = DSM 30166]